MKKDIANSNAYFCFALLTKKRHCLTAMSPFGCPDGLEPSTFRTTSTFTNCLTTRLYIVVSEDCENPFCGDFAAIFHMNSITLDRTFFTNSLFFIVFIT